MAREFHTKGDVRTFSCACSLVAHFAHHKINRELACRIEGKSIVVRIIILFGQEAAETKVTMVCIE